MICWTTGRSLTLTRYDLGAASAKTAAASHAVLSKHRPQQSARRALHSSETAITRVLSDMSTAADSKLPTVLLSLDISAAFDNLDHNRLLVRANDGMTLNWLHSYLQEQSVAVSGRRFPPVTLSIGVSQTWFKVHSCFLCSRQRWGAFYQVELSHTISLRMIHSSTLPSSRRPPQVSRSCHSLLTRWPVSHQEQLASER